MKNKAIVTTSKPSLTMADIADTADDIAMSNVLDDYRLARSQETIRRQKADLKCFAEYLSKAGVSLDADSLANDLSQWCGVSYGIVKGFRLWMVREGYSVGTVNIRMATIKRYCSLAREAGMISHETLANIKLIKGYTPKEADRVDENREKSNEATRKDNAKKEAHTKVSIEASVELKKQPDSRDRLLMCLLVDHGFRCGEITGLKMSDIDMALRHIHIKRPKVGVSGTQEMSVDVYNAMTDYLAEYKPMTFLFMGRSSRTGEWGSYGVRAINRRVDLLGNRVGIEHLSPHDLRHFWAWYAAYRGISIHRLKQAGGWKTLEMPDRYIGRSEIENEGMV